MRQFYCVSILCLGAIFLSAQTDSPTTNEPYKVVAAVQGGWRLVYGPDGAEVLDSLGNSIFDWPPPKPLTPRRDGFILMQRKDLYGLIDSSGRMILPPLYDWIANYEGIYAPVGLSGKAGLVDRHGNMAIPPVYKSIQLLYEKYYNQWNLKMTPPCTKNIWVFKKEDKLAFVHINSLHAAEPEFDDFNGFDEASNRGVVTKSGKKGFIDTLGRVVVEPEYDVVWNYDHNFSVVKKDKKIGMIDLSGKIVVPLIYDSFRSFDESGTIQFMIRDGSAIWLDTTGKQVTDPYKRLYKMQDEAPPVLDDAPPAKEKNISKAPAQKASPSVLEALKKRYDFVGDFEDGIAPVQLQDKYGLVALSGKELVAPQYGYISKKKDEKDIYTVIRPENSTQYYRYVSAEGGASAEYDDIDKFTRSGVAGVRRFMPDELHGVIDRTGREVVPLSRNFAFPEYQKQYIVMLNPGRTQYWLLKTDGTPIPGAVYDHVGESAVWLNHKVGFIDSMGALVIPPIFDSVGISDKSGWRVVKKQGQYGIIGEDLHLLLPVEYDHIGPFEAGYSVARKGNTYSFIETRDGQVTDVCPVSGMVSDLETGWLRVRRDGKWGWTDSNGDVRIPCRYDATTAFRNGRARVVLKPFSVPFWINTDGNVLLGWR